MDFLFGLQIAAIFLALLAHFTSVLREQLLGSRRRSRSYLFSYNGTGSTLESPL
jgi:hypothetical protein